MTGSSPDPAATTARPAATPGHHTPHHGHHHGAAHRGGSFHSLVSSHTPAPTPEVKQALQTAMAKENVPGSWEPGLTFIMAHESSGHVGVSNHTDSARGLFQLTRASYHLNPNGAASFGNAVEEAQGGIRYINQRYQTADNAVDFWQRHGWY